MVKAMTLDMSSGNHTPVSPRCFGMMEEFMYRHNPSHYRPVRKTIHNSLIAEPVRVIYDNSYSSCDDGQIYNRPSNRTTNMLTKLAAR